jgi:hypothetical protein
MRRLGRYHPINIRNNSKQSYQVAISHRKLYVGKLAKARTILFLTLSDIIIVNIIIVNIIIILIILYLRRRSFYARNISSEVV